MFGYDNLQRGQIMYLSFIHSDRPLFPLERLLAMLASDWTMNGDFIWCFNHLEGVSLDALFRPPGFLPLFRRKLWVCFLFRLLSRLDGQ